jgi:two-component system sensor histidine kinase BaeS
VSVTGSGWPAMTERRRGLGPLGRRLLAAFLLVALSSVVVLTVAALVGTARGLAAGEAADRSAAAAAVAIAAGEAYSRAGGWQGADLARADAVAADAGARLVVRDADNTVVRSPDTDGTGGMGNGMGGMGTGRAAVAQPVVVDGATVGSVRLVFGTAGSGSAQEIAWTWIIIAAVAALVAAFVVSWFVTRRISRPLVRLSATARSFAAGDRAARADAADAAAPGELGELARAFDATAEQVERSEAARRRMSADLAHELRTPLAALQAGLEELRDGLVPPDSGRLTALHDQSLRMGRVVQDLAELSAAETAALSLRRAALDLGELVGDAVASARSSMTTAGLSIVTRLAPGVVVDGDEDRLHQVVGNLLANTAHHCRAGDTVTVVVDRADGEATLSVADTGPGIDPPDLPSVFDRLWRGRADSGVEGSGIGLAVVRELVTAHGGAVRAVSDGEHGTTFTVLLPLVGAAAERGRAAGPTSQEG